MKRFQTLFYMVLILIMGSGCSSQKGDQNQYQSDVIVYGSSSAGVIAAVQAAKMGKEVILVSPNKHIGGLSASGLGWTDTGDKAVIGGLSREFYHRLYQHYQTDTAWKWQEKAEYGNVGQGNPAIDQDERTMWIFEPHAAEMVYENFIDEKDVTIHRDQWLNREKGVQMQDGRITSFTTLSGRTYEADMFIDATYVGDLMASAGVTYDVGREANSVYDETWNGVQKDTFHHAHHFYEEISPYKEPNNPSSGLLPRISDEDPGPNGSGDEKVQAYCYRMCLTKHPDNKVPITKPQGYDSMQYQLLARVFATGRRDFFHKYDPIPNRKTDVNNHGPFSTDNIGMNYDYPEASYERRREIEEEHRKYQQGLLYFVANNSQVPDTIQNEMQKWGYAKDEFQDNNHWPYHLYVREARRMKGDFVMTEHEILGRRDVEQPVGMGSYTMDSHNIQRYVTEEGYVQNEGDIGVHVETPYQIDYRSLVPKKDECKNLLVPVCLSSSHIAYGSIRMEPVFMILGQSAATAAVQAIDNDQAVQDIDYQALRTQLMEDGQVLSNEQALGAE